MRNLLRVLAMVFLSFASFAEDARYVKVNARETLSEILWKLNIKPIYGKRSKLKSILKLNPLLARRSARGHWIYPGDVIYLGETVSLPEGPKYEAVANIPAPQALPERSVSSAPAAEEVPAEKDFALSLSQSYHTYQLTLDTGEKATMASGLTPGVLLEGTFLNLERSRLAVKLKYQYLNLLRSKKAEISDRSFILGGMNLEYGQEVSPLLRIVFGVRGQEHIFFRKGTSQNVIVQKSGIRSYEIGGEYLLPLGNKQSAKLGARFNYYDSSSNQGYSYDHGYGFDFRLRVVRRDSLFAEPYYSIYRLDSGQGVYEWDELGVNFGYEF